MFYDFAITVPAKRAEATPIEQRLKLTHGIIHRVEVGFPSGCHGLVKVKLKHEEHQVWPSNPDGYFAASGYDIAIDEFYPLETAPYTLTFVGYAPLADYDHVITIRVGVLSKDILSPFFGIGNMLKKFLKLVGIGS